MGFWAKLEASISNRHSLVCVGLDPRPSRRPERFAATAEFIKWVIDETADSACAYKPNLAFYQSQGMAGLEALREIREYIPGDIPVILDAKYGDIGSTAEAYAQAAYEWLDVDAVTLSPYLGGDSVTSFAQEGRGIFVLCKTSNPSAPQLQDLEVDGTPLYLSVAQKALGWSGDSPVGLVVGATFPEDMAAIRRVAPEAWFLVPGIGAQGGDLEAVLRSGPRADGLGLIINSSRGIVYAKHPGEAARELVDRINAIRSADLGPVPTAARPKADDHTCLARLLFEAGCVRFGDFVLHSGAHSPVYVDLRRLVSFPRALRQVAKAYADLVAGLAYDRIAAIPYAGLPIGTAVSLQTGDPLIYPRRETKAYGTRKAIEGEFAEGETALLLDDLISSGGSKLEAIEPLEAAGLTVRDVAVLIDREQGGLQDLAQRGYRLHAVLTLRDLVSSLEQQTLLSHADAQKVREYLDEQVR